MRLKLVDYFFSITEQTGETPLEQMFILGEEFGFEALAEEGKNKYRSYAHHRIRSLSPRGGAAVVKETAVDESVVSRMRKYATSLIKALEWTGPIMVEFKQDAQTGRLYLMENQWTFSGAHCHSQNLRAQDLLKDTMSCCEAIRQLHK